ncbi:MAG TPA: hypothetical protein VJT33_18245 [bacterium]|nr:hypothetical protein [bacterium]
MENLHTLSAIVLTALQHTTAPMRMHHVDSFVLLRGVAALSVAAAAWLLVVFAMGATRPQDGRLTPAQDSQAAYKAAAAAWIKAKKSKS